MSSQLEYIVGRMSGMGPGASSTSTSTDSIFTQPMVALPLSTASSFHSLPTVSTTQGGNRDGKAQGQTFLSLPLLRGNGDDDDRSNHVSGDARSRTSLPALHTEEDVAGQQKTDTPIHPILRSFSATTRRAHQASHEKFDDLLAKTETSEVQLLFSNAEFR
jgi:hypothetical protein